MSSFYEAFERKRAEDLMHHGVKGMKWGVVNEPERLGRDPDMEWDADDREYASNSADSIRSASGDRIRSIASSFSDKFRRKIDMARARSDEKKAMKAAKAMTDATAKRFSNYDPEDEDADEEYKKVLDKNAKLMEKIKKRAYKRGDDLSNTFASRGERARNGLNTMFNNFPKFKDM